MEIKLKEQEKIEVFDLLAQDRQYETTQVVSWFAKKYPIFTNKVFNKVCDDWDMSFGEGVKCQNKHFNADLINTLLDKSGCLYVFSSEDKEQLRIAKNSLDYLEGEIERGCQNNISVEIFIRYADQLESCIEHLKSAVINYAQEHNKGDK